MTPRASKDVLDVLFEHVAIANEVRRRGAHLRQVVVDSAIAFLDREPRITAGFALSSRSRERYVRAEQLHNVAGIPDALAAEVPSRRRGERHRDFRIVNAGDVVAVRIDLRNEVRQRHYLPAVPARRPDDAARIGDAGQRRELHVLNANERCVVDARIAARRRRRAVCHPLVQRSQQRPHDVVLRRRIAQLLPCRVPGGQWPRVRRQAARGRKRTGAVLRPGQQIQPDVVG